MNRKQKRWWKLKARSTLWGSRWVTAISLANEHTYMKKIYYNSLFPAHQSQTKYFSQTFRQICLWPHHVRCNFVRKLARTVFKLASVERSRFSGSKRSLFLSIHFCNWWGQRQIWRNVWLKYFVWDWWAGNKELWGQPSQDRIKVIFEDLLWCSDYSFSFVIVKNLSKKKVREHGFRR